MVEAEEKLDRALRVRGTEERARRSRIRWIYATAASYATDALFLALFAAAGTIPALIPAVYAAATALVCLLAFLEGKIAKWWMPDAVLFVESLPHTATGKLSKLELRKQLADFRLPETQA